MRAPEPKSSLIRPQQAVTREILSAPQTHPGAIIDRVDRDNGVWIGERHRAGRARLPQRFEQRLVEKTLDVRRAQIMRCPAAMETHVKRAFGQLRRPFEDDRFGFFLKFLCRLELETAHRRRDARNRIVESRSLFGSSFNSAEQRYRIFDRHDEDVVVWATLDGTKFPQGAKRPFVAVLVNADDNVPVFHGPPPRTFAQQKWPSARFSLAMPTIDKAPKDIDAARANMNTAPQTRVFVGLKVAPEIGCELARLTRDLEQFPVRFVPTADIHLTLVPPWNETSIPEVVERLRLTADRFGAFALTFQHIGYGPQPRRPRLLWAECAATNDIVALHAALLQSCGQSDEQPFRPHVTLARICRNGFSIAGRHPIDRDLSFTQQVDSIELFQSPPPGERGYRILSSFRLGDAAHSISNT